MTVPDNTCLSFRNPILASPGLPVGLREMNNRPSVLQEKLALRGIGPAHHRILIREGIQRVSDIAVVGQRSKSKP